MSTNPADILTPRASGTPHRRMDSPSGPNAWWLPQPPCATQPGTSTARCVSDVDVLSCAISYAIRRSPLHTRTGLRGSLNKNSSSSTKWKSQAARQPSYCAGDAPFAGPIHPQKPSDGGQSRNILKPSLKRNFSCGCSDQLIYEQRKGRLREPHRCWLAFLGGTRPSGPGAAPGRGRGASAV